MTRPPSNELQSQLQTSLGAAYTLERELGGGGMSRVFVANETGLGRRVVVKVLAPELAEGISLERFEREIRLVASLQQANIVPLLSAGRTNGLPYYTMPLVEGRALRERLARDGALPLRDAVNILRDIARALAFAHDRGVAHRDIKPENILLSGETAVVTDFGIAKALSAARTDTEPSKLTLTGLGIGTPAYMAPEQAVGDPDVDQRADIYAFGCVAFEVFTGHPPFHGFRTHQIVAAHFHETPKLVASSRPEVPLAISDLVARCLEKDPSRRPQSARDLLQVLDTGSEPPPAPTRRPSATAVLGAVGLVAALVVGGIYMANRRSVPDSTVGQPATLAVLPFVNVGGDSAQEYLADGIRDEVATAIGKVPGVRIIGRSAAFRYRGVRDIDVRQVGHALGARYLLQGTLRQSNGRLSVSAQLSDSGAGAELWSGSFERSPQDLAHIRDDIVRAISDTLRSQAGLGVVSRQRRAPSAETTNPEAYDEYLRGEFLLQRRGIGVAMSVGLFEKAIALDPRFARAHAGLSAALVLLPYFTGTLPAPSFQRAAASARRAIELDSTLAEPHVSLGATYWHSAEPEQAEKEFRLALANEPDDGAALLQYGRFLLQQGRAMDALAQFTRAKRVDQVSALFSAWTSYTLFVLGRRDEALRESDQSFQLDSTLLAGVNLGALVNLAMGRKEIARRRLERVPLTGVMSNAACISAAAGDTAKAMQILRAIESQDPLPWFSEPARACVMLALGDTSRALTALEASAARVAGSWADFIPLADPTFDSIRGSARFATLLRKGGYPVATFTRPDGGRRR